MAADPHAHSDTADQYLFCMALVILWLYVLHGVFESDDRDIGKLCNLTCSHCHVEAGPTRTENADERLVRRVLHVLKRSPRVTTLDITGGSPEMNPHFELLVREARALGKHVMDRCNLTVFEAEGVPEHMPAFLAQHRVQLVASLPCYTPANVNLQRGTGTFEASLRALQQLNALGYGQADHPELRLDLVYNPVGAYLPGAQAQLEHDYKRELLQHFGVRFNSLYTITNMPIKRFADLLLKQAEARDVSAPSSCSVLCCRVLVR